MFRLVIYFVVLFCAVSGSPFVTRDGATLLFQGTPFTFSGPNIYWLGLDENVPSGTVAYPSKFRVDDALRTASLMGARVVRSHTLGISTGNHLSFEPSLDVFNKDALKVIDYAVHLASQLGLKLIVPFTDNYHYYHGGKHDFTDWLGVPETDFYTNPKVIAAFKRYISALLEHNNTYSGIQYKNDPTVMAWETGNELIPPAAWTKEIAQFLKSIDTNHLVLSGTFGVAASELPIDEVDMYSDHFYPPDAVRLVTGAKLCQTANKTYLAGEFGWSYNGTVSAFLEASQNNSAVNGDLYWSLFPHLDTFGFEQHGDGFTMHYPGDFPFMQTRNKQIQDHAWTKSGRIPQKVIIQEPPLLHPINESSIITWRGVAGGCAYNVMRAPASGSFSLLVGNVSDVQLPIVDPSPLPGSSQYAVLPITCDGTPGPLSNIVVRQ